MIYYVEVNTMARVSRIKDDRGMITVFHREDRPSVEYTSGYYQRWENGNLTETGNHKTNLVLWTVSLNDKYGI